MKRKSLVIILILIVALIVWWHYSSNNSQQISYLTEPVHRGDISVTVNAVGEVGATQLVTVGARVSGQIKSLKVTLGQHVNKGDLIAELDSTTQENELATNKAKLTTYQSQLASKRIEYNTAKTQYDRELKLMEKDATSEENVENARNTLAASKAAVDELQSLITQTKISVSTSEVNLGYTKIVAPMNGTVVSIPVEEGQTVNANQTTPTIIQLADLKEMEIKMQISEGDVTKIKPGMPVTYTILSQPDVEYKGVLASIDPGLTTLTDGTYTGAIDSSNAVYYYGKLTVPNPDFTLRIGLTTQNVITLSEAKNVLVIPTIAIKDQNGKKTVRVLQKEDAVVEKTIETGLSDNLNTEVKSGLIEGEKVIVSEMSAEEVKNSLSSTRMPRGPRM